MKLDFWFLHVYNLVSWWFMKWLSTDIIQFWPTRDKEPWMQENRLKQTLYNRLWSLILCGWPCISAHCDNSESITNYWNYKYELLQTSKITTQWIQRPNLMNLSGGLNLSGRSNMLGSIKNCIKFYNFNFWREMKTGLGGFKPRLKFIKFGHWACEMVCILVL